MRYSNPPNLHRCFNYRSQYYQLDDYKLPLPPQCPVKTKLFILETFTTKTIDQLELPDDCMTIEKEITGGFELAAVRSFYR